MFEFTPNFYEDLVSQIPNYKRSNNKPVRPLADKSQYSISKSQTCIHRILVIGYLDLKIVYHLNFVF